MFSRRTFEIAGFFTIAAALHVSAAAFMLHDKLQTGEAVPANAPAPLTAGGPRMQEMVKDWETPPQTEIATDMTQPEVETATDDMAAPAETAPRLAAMPDMVPPETGNGRPNLPPPPQAPRIAPATLDLPELQQMTPPDIQPDTALASSERPDRKPVRAAPKAEPARQAPAPQTARTTAPAAQTAPAAPQRAGQGGERRAASQGGGGGGVSAQTRASLTQQWGAQINQRISRQLARVGGTSGRRATMQIVIARNGRVQSVSLLSSTGNARLDQDILRAAQRTGSVPPAPAGLTDPTYTFSQVFRLR